MKILVRLLYWSWMSFIAFGCTVAQPPQLVSIANLPAFKPRVPDEITSVEQAMAAVITVCHQDLGLPVVQPLYLQFFHDTHAFTAGLRSSGMSVGLAQDTANFAWGVGQFNRILINTERTMEHPWRNLVRFLAHEYAHTVDYALAGSAARRSQWIREGFADWVAEKVLHSLGWRDYSASLHRAVQAVRRHKASLPSLSEVETFRDWLRVRSHANGAIMTYRFAFVAVDKLIEKKGVQAMLDYFSTGDFPSSFGGLSWSDFERELRRDVLG